MKTTEINTALNVYLIAFQFGGTNGKFITTNLGATIQANGMNKGIDYIKLFSFKDNKFKKISKAQILKFYSWHTEDLEILQNHSYFK